jgi:hypothetical protein
MNRPLGRSGGQTPLPQCAGSVAVTPATYRHLGHTPRRLAHYSATELPSERDRLTDSRPTSVQLHDLGWFCTGTVPG